VTLLDANVLVYYLDDTADKNVDTVEVLQALVDTQEQLVTSHHIIEEVLFVMSRIQPDADLEMAVDRIGAIPGLMLVEPVAQIEFAKKYAAIKFRLKMGINDALLLQLMLDADIASLYTYDKQFARKAEELGIKQITF